MAAAPQSLQLGIEAVSKETRLLEKEFPHKAQVMSLTFLAKMPSTYTSISANINAFSLRW